MSRGAYVDRSEAKRTTLRDTLQRYLAEVVPTKKGHQEACRVRALMEEPFAQMTLAELSSKHFAAYRDAELRRVSAKTVRPNPGTLSHVYTILIKEWGFGGLANSSSTSASRNCRRPGIAVSSRERRFAFSRHPTLRISRRVPLSRAIEILRALPRSLDGQVFPITATV